MISRPAYRKELILRNVRAVLRAKDRLLACTSKEDAEKIFDEFSITNFKARTELLRRCMQINKVYSTPGSRKPTDEETYKEELDFFLGGEWRALV